MRKKDKLSTNMTSWDLIQRQQRQPRAMCKVVGPKYFFLLYSQHQRHPTGKTLISNWSVNSSIMVIRHKILVVISAQTLTIHSHRQSAVSDVPRGWKKQKHIQRRKSVIEMFNTISRNVISSRLLSIQNFKTLCLSTGMKTSRRSLST